MSIAEKNTVDIVCAITVTYNPDTSVLRSQFDALQQQCTLIVVDNGSREEIITEIQKLVDTQQHGHLISLKSNIGIAAAQNMGIKCARGLKPDFSYYLTLDHDSVPEVDYVNRLTNLMKVLEKQNQRVASIGPILFDPRSNNRLKLHQIRGFMWKKVIPIPADGPIAVANVNSSGSLIATSALEECGDFDDTLFIDHVETEWCFRAIKYGWSHYVDQSTELEHRMGDDIVNYWLAGWKQMPYRSPTRHYYITRNSILLHKKSYVPKTWKFWNFCKLVFTAFYFGIFVSDSAEHRRYITKGIVDGYLNRSGKIRELSAGKQQTY